MIDIVVESITSNSKDIDAVFNLPGSASAVSAPITSTSSLSTTSLPSYPHSSVPSLAPTHARHGRAVSSTTGGLAAAAQTVTVGMPKSSSVPGNMTLFDRKVDVSIDLGEVR